MSTRLCESVGYVERNHEWATRGRVTRASEHYRRGNRVAVYRKLNRRLQFLIISSRAILFIYLFFFSFLSIRYPV